MQIEPGTRVLGVRVVDPDGRRLGRVAAAYCSPDPLRLVWLVLRLPGLRYRWRAVPARHACWHDATQTTLRVAHWRAEVLASPIANEGSLDTAPGRAQFEEFYAVHMALESG